MTPEQISDLLAHRDGERLDPAVSQRIEADAQARGELAVLRQLKHELNELPAVAPPPQAWANIQARAGKRPSGLARFAQRFPLATAASVFLAALLGIVVWDPANLNSGDRAPGPVAVPAVDLSTPQAASYAALVNRSQQLESALLYGGSASWTPAQEAMLLRIADLDAELSGAEGAELMSLEERQALWQQRVELLESLAQSRRARMQSVAF